MDSRPISAVRHVGNNRGRLCRLRFDIDAQHRRPFAEERSPHAERASFFNPYLEQFGRLKLVPVKILLVNFRVAMKGRLIRTFCDAELCESAYLTIRGRYF